MDFLSEGVSEPLVDDGSELGGMRFGHDENVVHDTLVYVLERKFLNGTKLEESLQLLVPNGV
jgi:hypothetical protein